MASKETVACWECNWRGTEDDCSEPDGTGKGHIEVCPECGSTLICEILPELIEEATDGE